MKRLRETILLLAAIFTIRACSQQPATTASNAYPVAIDINKVGKYPALTKSGAGYVYDDVLEYRVWIHVDGDDIYRAFATYEEAKHFSENTKSSEMPLVLVIQHEHINQPEPGRYEHVKGDRITEWRVEWLKGSKRGPKTIHDILRKKSMEATPGIEDGTYTFTMAFAEWGGKSLGATCKVIFKGKSILVVHDGNETVSGKKGDIIDKGILIRHLKTGNWIIGTSEEDAFAPEIGGCTDGPRIIDLKKKVFWTC